MRDAGMGDVQIGCDNMPHLLVNHAVLNWVRIRLQWRSLKDTAAGENFMFRKLLAGALLLALMGVTDASEGVRIQHAWIRLLPDDLPAGGYFVLDNQTNHTITLTGVSASAFAGAMLHRSAAGTMQHVHSVNVPAGKQLRFAPGGYHLMLMPPHDPLQPGDQVPVTFEFVDGSTLSADFLVKGAAAKGWSESK